MTAVAWLVPALPFVAALLASVVGRSAAAVTIGGTTISLALALAMLPGVLAHPAAAHVHAGDYTPTGSVVITAGTYVDGLSALVAVVVCGVALSVQVYSTRYLFGDRRYPAYTSFVSLFTAAMLLVVLSSDLFELYVGWEVMGICSYLLVGHYWESRRAGHAAIKAFVTTRLGDVPFLVGIFVLGTSAHSFALTHLGRASHGAVVTATLLLLGGVAGKSAQFPLQTWLPDAMAGPTPISALIHAATMVAAGVYVVARLYPLFVASPVTMDVLGAAAVVTMLLSALAALAQDDLKRVLAWSTVSQLAYMTAGLAVGGYQAALFHLVNHAAFKALLFLAAGSVLHAVGSNLMSEMGGLWRRMPLTFTTFLVGSLALAGLPPFSGAFSKDAILAAARDAHSPLGTTVLVAGYLTVVLTAAYTSRMVVRTFFGAYRGRAQLHEAPPAMAGPLVALAAPSAALGLLALPGALPRWLPDPVHGPTLPVEVTPLLVSVALVLLGAAGPVLYLRAHPAADPVRLLPARVRTAFDRGLRVDDLYRVGVVLPFVRAGRWFAEVDRAVVDGAVEGTGTVTRLTARVVRLSQTGNMQHYATAVFIGAVAIALAVAAS